MSRNKAKNRNIQQQSDRVHCYIAAWVVVIRRDSREGQSFSVMPSQVTLRVDDF